MFVAADRLKDGHTRVCYGALDACGSLDVAATATLVDLIYMAHWGEDSLRALKDLVSQAESGMYISPNPDLPDFGINDVNLWLAVPKPKPSTICVTNENTEFTHEAGGEQYFSFQQFWHAMSCYERLAKVAVELGADRLVEGRVEMPCAVTSAPNTSLERTREP
jgi:hypothetical protein